MKQSLCFIFFCVSLGFSLSSYSQGISGNVASQTNSFNLDYANVEIYKGDNLVASLITDENGYYDIALDTGTYVVNIMYSGYETQVQEIKVLGNESNNVSLNESKENASKKRNREVLMKLEMEKSTDFYYSPDEDIEDDGVLFDISDSGSFMLSEGLIAPEHKLFKEPKSLLYEDGFISSSHAESQLEEAYAYGLTAGEINDFSKWDLWTDVTKGDLKYYQKTWKLAPTGRFSVLVSNENGIPIPNAKVSLMDSNKKAIWNSRTDNLGRAELWENIQFPIDSMSNVASSISIEYNGVFKTIDKIKEFHEGVNIINIEHECPSENMVDIAFLVDATGSMQDEIDYLKLDINKVIYEAKKSNEKLQMNFASVFYRDHGENYITKHKDFTKVLSESASFIENQNASGGGDAPEAFEEALEVAIDSLSWSENARTRILFMVLDAPCHNNSKIQRKIRELTKKASQKGIRLIPITGSGINKSAEYLMRSLSISTNGTYVFLTDHSGIGNGHIEPSTDEYEVEILNILLQRIIKTSIFMPSCEGTETLPELFTELPDSLVTYEIPIDSLGTPLDSLLLNIPDDQLFPDEISWNYYPNPTFGPLNIEVSQGVRSIYLTDMSGKLVKEIFMDGDLFINTDISGLPMGIYFLRYPIGKKWLTGKVVLMR